jgi:hypothetical protein
VDLGSQVGWYYLVGSATGDDGKQYGVLVMLSRTSLLPPPIAQHFGLSEVENQVVELQFAISEAGDRHDQATPTVVAGTTGLLDYKSDEFFSVLGKNAIMTLPESEDGSVPLRVQALGWDRGATPTVELAVALSCQRLPIPRGPRQPPGCARETRRERLGRGGGLHENRRE